MSRKSIYLIAGHGDDDGALLARAFRESGLRGPQTAYIGTANGETPMFRERMSSVLVSAGAGSVIPVRLLGSDADEDSAEKILRASPVIFISGGEVEDGMNGLSPRIRRVLRELYDGGTLFIGISAGTIMMGAAWPHWDDEDNDFDNARLFDCLGFVPCVFDTHCEDEGWPELIKAVSLSPEGAVGRGIPSGGMAVAAPDGTLTFNIAPDVFVSRSGKAVRADD